MTNEDFMAWLERELDKANGTLRLVRLDDGRLLIDVTDEGPSRDARFVIEATVAS